MAAEQSSAVDHARPIEHPPTHAELQQPHQQQQPGTNSSVDHQLQQRQQRQQRQQQSLQHHQHHHMHHLHPMQPPPQPPQHQLPPPQHLPGPPGGWLSIAAPVPAPLHHPHAISHPHHHPHPHPHHYYPSSAVHHHVHHPPHVAVHHLHGPLPPSQPTSQGPPPPAGPMPTGPPPVAQPHDIHYAPAGVMPPVDRVPQLEAELAAAHREIDALRTKLADVEKERAKADTAKTQSRYWTPDEHKRFLEALQKFGPKDVRAIANFVGSRNATQVRTHAQKYFLRVAREHRGSPVASLQNARKRSMSESDLVRVGHVVTTPPDSPLMTPHSSVGSGMYAAGLSGGIGNSNGAAGGGPLGNGAGMSQIPTLPSPLAVLGSFSSTATLANANPANANHSASAQGTGAQQAAAPSAALPPSGLPTSAPPTYQMSAVGKPPSPRTPFPSQASSAMQNTSQIQAGIVRMQLDPPVHNPSSSATLPSLSKPPTLAQPVHPPAIGPSTRTPPRRKSSGIPDNSGINLLSIVASERKLVAAGQDAAMKQNVEQSSQQLQSQGQARQDSMNQTMSEDKQLRPLLEIEQQDKQQQS